MCGQGRTLGEPPEACVSLQDSPDLLLLLRLLALGQGAWDMIDSQVFKEPKMVTGLGGLLHEGLGGRAGLGGAGPATGGGQRTGRGWAQCATALGPAPQEVELVTRFLPMLMSFVVDDHTFNVDQKLPAEEKAPVTYPNTLPESFTKYGCGRAGRARARGLPRGLTAPGRRFLQEQRMACEVGLYYVLHITKQRNKNALLRLLPGLGECEGGRAACPPQTPSALATTHVPEEPVLAFPSGQGARSLPAPQTRARALPTKAAERPVPPATLLCTLGGTLQARKTGGHPGAPSGASCRLSRGVGASRRHLACPPHNRSRASAGSVLSGCCSFVERV